MSYFLHLAFRKTGLNLFQAMVLKNRLSEVPFKKSIVMKNFYLLIAFFCVLQDGYPQNRILQQGKEPHYKDIVYATVDTTSLKLDIYLPEQGRKPYPVVVWIHGGAWSAGSKEKPQGIFLLKEGYALVSINYRLSQQAVFPAQIYDCKGAIRWIKANADKYNFNPKKIGVMGSSAGGHLVAMLGVTGDVPELEGTIGDNTKFNSKVNAVCDWFGPANLITMGDYPSGMNHRNANSPEGRLIGGAILENREKALNASPVSYASKTDPAFLILHGTKDNTVPFHQSVELDSTLRAAGVKVIFKPVKDAGHGGPEFNAPEVQKLIVDFFNKLLR